MAPRNLRDDPAPSKDADRPFTILVVDDDPDTRASLRALFEQDEPSFLVLTAASGPEGLDLLAGAAVDAVLADYRMKPMNGLEFLVMALHRAPRVRRLMLTAYPDMKLAIDAVNKGRIEHFFVKPVDPAELLQAVRALRAEREATADRARGFARSLDELRRQSHR